MGSCLGLLLRGSFVVDIKGFQKVVSTFHHRVEKRTQLFIFLSAGGDSVSLEVSKAFGPKVGLL